VLYAGQPLEVGKMAQCWRWRARRNAKALDQGGSMAGRSL
jgi:hypothetical protein